MSSMKHSNPAFYAQKQNRAHSTSCYAVLGLYPMTSYILAENIQKLMSFWIFAPCSSIHPLHVSFACFYIVFFPTFLCCVFIIICMFSTRLQQYFVFFFSVFVYFFFATFFSENFDCTFLIAQCNLELTTSGHYSQLHLLTTPQNRGFPRCKLSRFPRKCDRLNVGGIFITGSRTHIADV